MNIETRIKPKQEHSPSVDRASSTEPLTNDFLPELYFIFSLVQKFNKGMIKPAEVFNELLSQCNQAKNNKNKRLFVFLINYGTIAFSVDSISLKQLLREYGVNHRQLILRASFFMKQTDLTTFQIEIYCHYQKGSKIEVVTSQLTAARALLPQDKVGAREGSFDYLVTSSGIFDQIK